MPFLKRVLRALPLLLLSPFVLIVGVLALALTDLVWKISGPQAAAAPLHGAADAAPS